MENRRENEVRIPTSAELYAYELEARRLRAAELSKLAKSAVRAFRAFVTVKSKEMKHA